MGRPPNHGGGSRFTGERERQPRRHFSLPIPSVDSLTFEAVQKYIRAREPCLVHRAAWDQARSKAEMLKEEVEVLRRRLNELNEEKEQAIRDIEETRDEQLERTLQKMERKIRHEHEREQKEKDEEFELEIKMDKERHEKKMEILKEKRIMAREKKRPKLNPESEKKGDIAGNDKTDDDSSDLEEGELMEEDTAELNEEAAISSKSEQASKNEIKNDTSDSLPPTRDKKDDTAKPNEKLESETRTEELKKIESQMENLKETKSQMVWLLRQVITAEKKRKEKELETKRS